MNLFNNIARIKTLLSAYFRNFFEDEKITEYSRNDLISKAIIEGYSAEGIDELLNMRPEFLITPNEFIKALWLKDARINYPTITEIAQAKDDDGSWLWPDIYHWKKLQISCQAKKINDLGRLKLNGYRLFPSLISIIDSNATNLELEDLQKMLKSFSNESVFEKLRFFLAKNGKLEHIEYLQNIEAGDGKKISWRARDLEDFMTLIEDIDSGWQKVRDVLGYISPSGNEVFFNYFEDVLSFVFAGGDVSLLQSLTQYSRPINGYEAALIAKFKDRIPNLFSSKKFQDWPSEAPINALIMAEIIGAGTDFSNDKRPKCLLLLEVEDFREGGLPFLSYCHHLMNLTHYYDTRVVSAYTRKDFMEAVKSAPNDLSVLVTAFHGAPRSVSLCRTLERYGVSHNDSDRSISIVDVPWYESLESLPKTCSLLMLSCLTAKGGNRQENLANVWKEALGSERLVTAFKTSIRLADIHFIPVIPDESLVIPTIRDKPVTVYLSKNVSREESTPFQGDPIEEVFEKPLKRILRNDQQAGFQRLLAELRISKKGNYSGSEQVDLFYKDLLTLPGVSEYQLLNDEQRRNMSSFGFVFGMLLSEPWATPYGNYFKGVAENPWDYLNERGYETTKSLNENVVVIYIAPERMNCWMATDYGLYRDGRVIRKLHNIIAAPLEYCPPEYSHYVLLKSRLPHFN